MKFSYAYSNIYMFGKYVKITKSIEAKLYFLK